ncbi:hypothetical protein ABBQ32_005170 [Trebouxia sp. C0010 RCD-2024]
MHARALAHSAMDLPCTQQTLHVVPATCMQPYSRKRPFSAVSLLHSPKACSSRYTGCSKRSSSPCAELPRCLVRAQAASVDTEDLVSTPVGSDEARPKVEPLPQKQRSLDWFDHWYAIGYEKDFDEKKPNAFTLLGKQLCIWKDASNRWQAFLDVCPHRLVPLSEGRITDAKELQCAYHGWCFEASGKCTAIPQGGNVNNPRTFATVYQCAVKQGLIWVKPIEQPRAQPAASAKGSSSSTIDTSDIPILPEIDEGWIDSATFRDLPYDYATLLENLFDVGHVPFTHHASVSKRSSADVIKLDMQAQGPTGFTGRNERGPRRGQLGAQDTLFQAPCLMRHSIDAQDSKGFSNITAVYATPTTPGRCRAIIRNLFKFKSPIPRFFFKVVPAWSTHVGNNTVLEDDVVFLHKQEELAVARGLGQKAVAQVYHMPGSSDNFVTAFRTWLSKYGGGGPFGPMDHHWLQAAGPRLDRDALLDRFHTHTANCKVCSSTLQTIQQIRSLLKYLVGGLAVAAAILAAVALSASDSSVQALAAQQEAARGLFAAGGQLLLRGTKAVVGSGKPGAVMASAAVCVVLAVVLLAVRAYLSKMESNFIHGVYPPPRNVKLPHDEA